MEKLIQWALVGCLVLLASGCATVSQPINYSGVTEENARIGILLAEPADATTAYTGQIGLLDYAIIAGMNDGLDEYLATLTFDDYLNLPSELATIVSKQGQTPIIIEPRMSLEKSKELKAHKDGISSNNYSEYQQQNELDYLLVVRLASIGTTRPYYGPVPTAEPSSQAIVWGELVDLDDNRVLWFRNVSTVSAIPEPWDEADTNYPNLTDSVYEALNSSLETIRAELAGSKVSPKTAALNN